jgi:hypothetical protein
MPSDMHVLKGVIPLSQWLHALPQGLDFFFANRQHAVKLVDFLQVSDETERNTFPLAMPMPFPIQQQSQ